MLQSFPEVGTSTALGDRTAPLVLKTIWKNCRGLLSITYVERRVTIKMKRVQKL